MARTAPTHVISRADVSLVQWHRWGQWATFTAALGLMLLSIVGIHWALTLIGIPSLVAWLGGLLFEVGAAATAALATSMDHARARVRLGLGLVFVTLMAAMVVMNIGHALTYLAINLPDPLPAGIDETTAQVFAALIAALFPLCGTMLVHVSGAARAHSVDARWSTGQTIDLAVDAPEPARVPRGAPAPRAPRAQSEQPVPVEQNTEVREPAPEAPRVRARFTEDERRVYARYVERLRTTGREPQGSEIAEWLHLEGARDRVVTASQGNRWRDKARAEHAEEQDEQIGADEPHGLAAVAS